LSKKRNEEKSVFAMGTGVSSLLVIFAILCITVFAVLSVSSASADSALSEKTAVSVKEYYAADSEAEKILSEIRSGNIPDNVTCEGDTYKYVCHINDTRELRVEVTVNGSDYLIERWQTVYTGSWENDESMNVWGGE